jgi:serine/threonine protein kinase
MSFCHNRGIVHRDLKLENVLFKSKGDLTVKIVDFGIAGVCAGNKNDKVDAGSIAYMPPEVNKYY